MTQGPLSEPQNIGEHPKNKTIFPSIFEKWLVSCCGNPRFLSRLNLQLYPVLSTSKEAKLQIHDHKGPYQSPKMIHRDLFATVFSLCLTLYKQSPSLRSRGKKNGEYWWLVGQRLETATVTNELVFEEIYLLWECFWSIWGSDSGPWGP